MKPLSGFPQFRVARQETHSVNIVTPRCVLHDVVHLVGRHRDRVTARRKGVRSVSSPRPTPVVASMWFLLPLKPHPRASPELQLNLRCPHRADEAIFAPSRDFDGIPSVPVNPIATFRLASRETTRLARACLCVFRHEDSRSAPFACGAAGYRDPRDAKGGKERENSRPKVARDLLELEHVGLLALQVSLGDRRVGDGRFGSGRGVHCGGHDL